MKKLKRFEKIYIEITNICNMNCSFCPKHSRKSEIMNKAKFEHILREIKPYTDYIYFHLMGEPLMHPELKLFLDISYSYGFLVNITTNGVLLPDKKEILLNSPALRKVAISLHSFEVNDTILSLEEYIENCADFSKEASERGIISELRLWNIDNSDNPVNDKIIQILKERLQIKEEIEFGLKNKRSIKIRDRTFLGVEKKFEWPDISKNSYGENLFCYGLRSHVGILADGTVVPCCLDSDGNIPLGNVFNEDFERIINSDRANRLYDGFSKRYAAEELCRKCGYAKMF